MHALPYLLITVIASVSVLLKKLTFAASLAAILIAVSIFWGAGYSGLEMLGAFFALAVIATGWRKRDKAAFKRVDDRGNRRNAAQVLANGGVAAMPGLLALLPAHALGQQTVCLTIAGSLSAALADTLSSELGMVFGRRFFNIVSFKPDQKGLDGVCSLEGTLVGVAGAMVIALVYSVNFSFSSGSWIIVIAGATGNYVDSLLGATLERERRVGNNMVNFLNTLTGALAVLILTRLC